MTSKFTPLLGVLFLLIISGCSSRKEKLDCTRFKEGSFTYQFDITHHNVSVKRFPKYQVEINRSTGATSKFRIDWISDCRYELTMIETTANYSPEVLKKMKNTVVNVEIIDVDDNYYVFKGDAGIFYPTITDTMWVMK